MFFDSFHSDLKTVLSLLAYTAHLRLAIMIYALYKSAIGIGIVNCLSDSFTSQIPILIP